jgi:FkbM family methyltransferase
MTQLLFYYMSSTRLNATVEQPRWPGRPFHVACPTGTLAEHCALLSRTSKMAVVRERKGPGCSEPEDDTAEVLSSLLEGCDTRNCLYVDVGCNIGYFAMHAAALGAHVDCAEPTPFYVDAINTSIALNHFPEGQVKLRQVAITAAPAKAAVPRDGIPYSWRMVMQASSASDPSELTFSSAYAPCDIGLAEQRKAAAPQELESADDAVGAAPARPSRGPAQDRRGLDRRGAASHGGGYGSTR